MTRLTDLERSADKAVRYFSGTISYNNSFKLPLGYKPGASLLIDLGRYGDGLLAFGQAHAIVAARSLCFFSRLA
jgi:hypothetical protein